jgi:hypothetical protein
MPYYEDEKTTVEDPKLIALLGRIAGVIVGLLLIKFWI